MYPPEAMDRLARELSVPLDALRQTAALLDAKLAVPFLAHYRRDHTGGLDEPTVWAIARRLRGLRILEGRKATILKQIEAQGKLTDRLRQAVSRCTDRAALEDLYLPFRSKRRTRGTLAIERGLEPLAMAVLRQELDAETLERRVAAEVAPGRGLPDAAAVRQGVCHILAERIAEHPEARRLLRALFAEQGTVRARLVEGKKGQHSKYEMYYDFAEPAKSIPSHRFLAVRRGEKEGWLRVSIAVDREGALAVLRQAVLPDPGAPTAPLIEEALADACDRLLGPALETETRASVKRRADAEAIAVFARNLRSLLLQPPAGPRRTLGVEPGYRTGCKLAAVDERGALLDHRVIFPHPPQGQAEEARQAAKTLIETHGIEAVAIGNGTASRETGLFFRQLRRELAGRRLLRMVVNSSGAGAYATSKAAQREFPDLDPGLRAAVSIARRFQDPLAELVGVDPKSIGVGQYQHDVNQQALRRELEAVVHSVVNAVGADPNRAAPALLAYVAGLDRRAARAIVAHREDHGPFATRADLRAVRGLDEHRRTQAAGFLRIPDGPEPLDATAVHPELYPLVERIAADAGTDVASLLGNRDAVGRVDFARYAGERAGPRTLEALKRELLSPGRDPRPPFRCVEFRDDLTTVDQLQEGMVLEGVVTNVTNFGAFVDVGVQEDGLVHVSQLARRYVEHPSEAVHVGQIVRVKVLSVDRERRRIGLSIKQATPKRKPRPKPPRKKAEAQEKAPQRKPQRDPKAKATREDIERLIAHFGSK
ncbi:MAG: S1 RNA-binding domain-containing protein [Candidatus Brocadiia bacterium]